MMILGLATVQAQDSFEKALIEHVRELTSPKLMGRETGTAGESDAAAYISRQFSEKGLELLYPGGYQDFSFVDNNSADTLFSQNVVAVIPGYDPQLREETCWPITTTWEHIPYTHQRKGPQHISGSRCQRFRVAAG